MNRSRKTELKYRHYQQNLPGPNYCQFCEVGPQDAHYIRQTNHFKIIRNLFAYSLWDEAAVADHLLILPMQHIDTLAHLTKDEAHELVQLINHYETQGYNIYARAAHSDSKSVAHQHTHLIKTHPRSKRLFFFLKRPYIRWSI